MPGRTRTAGRTAARGRHAPRPSCWAAATWPSPWTRGRTRTATRASSAIEGGSLAEMALHYFRTSEQLRCFGASRLRPDTEAGWRAGALVLEKIAGAGGIDPGARPSAGGELAHRQHPRRHADRRRAAGRALPPERLLYRLFHTRGRGDRPAARRSSYGCRCSRARLAGILEGFPPTIWTTWRWTATSS